MSPEATDDEAECERQRIVHVLLKTLGLTGLPRDPDPDEVGEALEYAEGYEHTREGPRPYVAFTLANTLCLMLDARLTDEDVDMLSMAAGDYLLALGLPPRPPGEDRREGARRLVRELWGSDAWTRSAR